MQVIAMRSFPGGGKTMHAQRLTEDFRKEGKIVTIFSADDEFIKNGVYTFNPALLSKAHTNCFVGVVEACQLNSTWEPDDVVIVDNTNLNAFEISPYAMVAASVSADFKVISVLPTRDVDASGKIAFSRQTHGVPEHAHKRMVEQFKKNDVLPWWQHETVLLDEIK